ncbi:MAG: EVE domain-containing protein [Acidobacteriota bacterium]|nr:EVE domain-containing protein [Acidobacteriota bacterium]
MKCEPAAYTIDDLEQDGTTSWEGVRNYMARNYMRDDMRAGDPVLFYASNAAPSGVTGLARIARAAYPDHFAAKAGHKYFDESASKDNPIWYMVDLAFVRNFHGTVPLAVLKQTTGLEKMGVTQKGSRLSVQPVTRAEYEIVVRLARTSLTPQRI